MTDTNMIGPTAEAERLGYYACTADMIGDTPLVRLHTVTRGLKPLMLAKVEFTNPGGSSKDRIAVRMIDQAEAQGLLRPGGTIIEPTSGNTGAALAMIGRMRGYRCVLVCQDKVSPDKIAVMRAYGGEVVVCPSGLGPRDPDFYLNVADHLAATTPGAWRPDQYSNPHNPRAHYATTGPEIWRQTRGRITHFVAGIGTGGTVSGAGRYLKEASHGRVQVIGADPQGSVFSGGSGDPYLLEAVGECFWPANFDTDICDDIITITDHVAFHTARQLARDEGLLVGGSSGMAAAAALHVAAALTENDLLVVLLPDSGKNYLSKIFNDAWMAEHGFLPHQRSADQRIS